MFDSSYDSSGNLTSQTKTSWTYDADDRLTQEVYDVGNNGPTSTDYTDNYTYDLAGNRASKTHNAGSDATIDELINYTYNSRDQLTQEVSSSQGTIT